MAIKVASWNILDGFSKEDHIDPIIDIVRSMEADVAVFPEAYDDNRPDFVEDVTERFKELDYETIHGPYEPLDDHEERHGIMAISRLGTSGRLFRLGVFNAVQLFPVDPVTKTTINFVGAHFDDRRETSRLIQARQLVQELFQDQRANVLAGDLNAMHGGDLRTRLIGNRAVGSLARHVPHARAQSIATRLHGMASGTTIELLETNSLRDADPSHQPTWPSRWPQFVLDHIMISADIHPTAFEIHPANRLSDHNAITATLQT